MEKIVSEEEFLIRRVAKKFYNVEKEDLYQAGYLGLIKAQKNYKEEFGPFLNYAYKYIFGEMYELSVKSRNIKLNKYYLNLYKLVIKSRSYLAQVLNKEPTFKEISDYIEFPVEEIEYVSMLCEDMFSLDDEYENIQIGVNSINEDEMILMESIESLDPLSSLVLKYRYKEDMTQSEVAKVLGISQVKVSRLESKGKQELLEYIS